MMHLADGYKEERTLCGLTLSSLSGEEWTDDTLEVATHPRPGDCPDCIKAELGRIKDTEDYERYVRQEQAMEEGMLHGIDAYNDAMGY